MKMFIDHTRIPELAIWKCGFQCFLSQVLFVEKTGIFMQLWLLISKYIVENIFLYNTCSLVSFVQSVEKLKL